MFVSPHWLWLQCLCDYGGLISLWNFTHRFCVSIQKCVWLFSGLIYAWNWILFLCLYTRDLTTVCVCVCVCVFVCVCVCVTLHWTYLCMELNTVFLSLWIRSHSRFFFFFFFFYVWLFSELIFVRIWPRCTKTHCVDPVAALGQNPLTVLRASLVVC